MLLRLSRQFYKTRSKLLPYILKPVENYKTHFKLIDFRFLHIYIKIY